MSDSEQTAPFVDSAGRPPSGHDSADKERGRTHGLSLILWLIERDLAVLLALPTLFATLTTVFVARDWRMFVLSWLAVPLLGVVAPLLFWVYRSHRHDAGSANWEALLSFRDPALAARFRGKKIPMEVFYEAYLAERADFKADIHSVLLRRNELFRFCFTWGDVKFYFLKFLGQNLGHGVQADQLDVAPVYNRGNDFYQWFLGESMVYTCGIFRDESESLEAAQLRKLETICASLQLRPGDRHLDIGCGWGGLVAHAAQRHGTRSMGVTLAEEQVRWAKEVAERAGVAERVEVSVKDYRELAGLRFDKISCVEMAEHVGIKNFQRFLCQVRDMLEDDGLFYLQIAGLRRAWHYEDLVWGMFMAKYVFPGADASCPLGFVISQAERAGFEVHRVENCGVHYALTIEKWYDNWLANAPLIVAKYGERWFRTWALFLAWSRISGAQGSAALFMITLNKSTKHDKRTLPLGTPGAALDRRARFIGPNPVATQP
jgi:cyclopropane fatty-acyl-phospholipid synthase-like methyltransferase